VALDFRAEPTNKVFRGHRAEILATQGTHR
jgi:hypothetical protein